MKISGALDQAFSNAEAGFVWVVCIVRDRRFMVHTDVVAIFDAAFACASN